MSQIGMIIEERSRDIGDFLVGRLLPFRKKRMVGPFVFLDHMGPITLGPGKRFDVEPHPHIGLSTLTYLFEGEIIHRDSIGTEQKIKAGAVNLMTAGKGVTHSERSDPKLDNADKHMHGLQIWIALPKEKEDMEPEFHHTPSTDLPSWEKDDLQYRLVAGKAYGRQSPVPAHSSLFMVELVSKQSRSFTLDRSCEGERALYVLKGSITTCGEKVEAGNLLVTKEGANCAFEIGEDSHVILFGGEPYPEERHIFWNFVSTDKKKIALAKERWKNREFPSIPNDEGYVPLPGTK